MKKLLFILIIFISFASIACTCAESSVDNVTICNTHANADNMAVEHINDNLNHKDGDLNKTTEIARNDTQNKSPVELNVNVPVGGSISKTEFASHVNLPEGGSLVISLPADATGNMSVIFSNKTVSAPVINGIASISIKNIPVGNYYNTNISYSGDEKYAPVNKTVNINVCEVISLKIFVGHLFLLEHMESHDINWMAKEMQLSVYEVKELINDIKDGKYGAVAQKAILKKLDDMKQDSLLLKSYIINDFKSVESSEKLINKEHNPELANEISQLYGRCTLQDLTNKLGITTEKALIIIYDMKNGEYGISMENSIKRANFLNNMHIEIFESYLF